VANEIISYVWRHLRLTTLVVLTAILAVPTSPTWVDLVSPPTLAEWNAQDSITVFLPVDLIDKAKFEISGDFYSTRDQYSGDKPVFLSSIHLSAQLRQEATSATVYIRADGQTARLLDLCDPDTGDT
jgi:hypothetical protein